MEEANTQESFAQTPKGGNNEEPNIKEEAILGLASNLAEVNPIMLDAELAEEAAIMHDSTEGEPMKWKLLYIALFVMISLNDGLILGYNSFLVADFTEKKVPSALRSLLYVVTIVYFFRILVAPITDKYFFEKVGRRKSYLVPCKLLATMLYLIMSFWIDDLVEHTKIVRITLFFLVLSIIMVFENNAMAGFRVDFFGKREASAAGAAATISLIAGVSIGLQVFNALNSKSICTEYLGASDSLLSHGGFFRFIALINIMGLFIMTVLKDDTKNLTGQGVSSASSNPVKVIKALFFHRRLRNFIVFNIIGPTLSVGLKVAVSQYYWKKGLKKDYHILAIGVVMIPYTIISNLIWLRITKKGHLMFLMWVAVLIAVLAESVHIFNYRGFTPGENGKATIIRYCLILGLDAFANWLMVQGSILIKAAPHPYAITFIASINSIISIFRLFPLAIMTALVDAINFELLVISSVVCQGVLNLVTYKMVVDVDKEDPHDMGVQFAKKLESMEEN